MPLTANFLADFSSFVNAAADATRANDDIVESAGRIGRAMDDAIAGAVENVKGVGSAVADFAKSTWTVLSSDQLQNFGRDVKTFAMGYIDEFAEAEAATVRLNTALGNAGHSGAAEAYAQMATELQRVSTFSDEAITDAQTMFTTVGNVAPENMRKVLQATMDLAVGMGKDLPAATKLMAKAASSDGEALGKLKEILGDSVEKGASFEQVIDAINKKFTGESAAAVKTTAGQMENLKNQMSDVNEQVGQVFAENLQTILGLFQSMPEGIQTFTIAAVGIGTAIAPVLVSLSSLISLLNTAGVGTALLGVFKSLLPFLGPAGWIAAGLIALVAVWKNWDTIVAVAQDAYNEIKTALNGYKALFDHVVEWAKGLYQGVKMWLWDQLSALVDRVVGLPGRIVGGFKALFDAVVGHSYVPDLIDGIEHHFGRLDAVMVRPTFDSIKLINDKFQEFAAGGFGLGEVKNISDFFEIDPTGRGLVAKGPGPAWGAATGWGGTVSGDASASAWGRGAVNVTVNMHGMLGSDDPQTRARVNDLVSDAVMQGMRNGRLLGTA